MGKASRRKRQQPSSSHGDRPHPAAAGVPAPNFDRTAVQAIRDALAMVTSVHASPQDLPGLVEELAADRGRQGLVAYALVSRFITESVRELADARGITVPAVLEGITAGLETGDAEHHTALNRALTSVRDYAEVPDDLRPPGTLTADLDANLGPGPASCSYLIALTRIAYEMITAHCAETGEDVASYLQRGVAARCRGTRQRDRRRCGRGLRRRAHRRSSRRRAAAAERGGGGIAPRHARAARGGRR